MTVEGAVTNRLERSESKAIRNDKGWKVSK